ncbi:MAG: thioesterase family protein [Oscillospiraceae bacterium]
MKSTSKICVRYAETDAMGVVYHSNYAVWYEIARTDYIKKLGLTYTQMEQMGVMTPVVELYCKYISPAKYEDELIVEVELINMTRVKLEFEYNIYREGEVKPINTGRTLHAMVDHTMKPINVQKKHPEFYEKLFAAFQDK